MVGIERAKETSGDCLRSSRSMKKTKAPYRIRAIFDMVNRYAYGAGFRVGLEHAGCVSVRANVKGFSAGGTRRFRSSFLSGLFTYYHYKSIIRF